MNIEDYIKNLYLSLSIITFKNWDHTKDPDLVDALVLADLIDGIKLKSQSQKLSDEDIENFAAYRMIARQKLNSFIKTKNTHTIDLTNLAPTNDGTDDTSLSTPPDTSKDLN
jgi:hypothetical protein